MTARQRADRLLVARGLFDSRTKAQAAIAAGLVTADEQPVRKASDTIAIDAKLVAAPAFPWVSRGGVKLAHALDMFAVGENRYIPVDPAYDDGTLLGTLRVFAGGHVSLEASFTNHARYVKDVTTHARTLEAGGYLLKADADTIIKRANQSDIGRE